MNRMVQGALVPLIPLAIASVLTAYILTACPMDSILREGAAGISETPLVEERESRHWRLVFLFLDDNELAPAADLQIATIVAAPETTGSTHRIILRDSGYTGNSVDIVHDGRLIAVPIPDLAAPPLVTRETLHHTMAVLHREFPAENQILVVSGHGRGWRGIGVTARAAQPPLNGSDLGALAAALPDEVYQLVVLEAGWSAFGENLYSLAGSPTDILAAPEDISAGGMDHQRWITAADESAWEHTTVAEALQREMSHVMIPGEHTALFLTADQLSAMPNALAPLFTYSGRQAIDLLDQEMRRGDLLSRVTAPVIPGEAHITAGTLCNLEDDPACPDIPPEYASLLFHVVLLDEHRRATGHSRDYRVHGASGDFPFITSAGWAPDLLMRRGSLFELWYRTW